MWSAGGSPSARPPVPLDPDLAGDSRDRERDAAYIQTWEVWTRYRDWGVRSPRWAGIRSETVTVAGTRVHYLRCDTASEAPPGAPTHLRARSGRQRDAVAGRDPPAHRVRPGHRPGPARQPAGPHHHADPGGGAGGAQRAVPAGVHPYAQCRSRGRARLVAGRPGCRCCCWRASWPSPSRRSCATGCCTSPPGSPARAAAQFNQGSRPGPLHQFQHRGHLRLHRRGCPTRHPQSRPGSSR